MDASADDTLERGLRALLATAETARAPELASLTAMLAHRLLGATRPAAPAPRAGARPPRHVRLDAAVARELAQAQLRAGDVAAAEATVRTVLKRDAADAEAQRLLYRLLKQAGRTAEAHAALDRLVELDPTSATATFAHRERAKLGPTGGRAVKIALLSSYVLDPLVPFLDAECRRAGLTPAFYVAPYNQYTQDILSPASGLHAFGPDVVFLALDLEDVFPAIGGVPSADELARGKEELRTTIVSLCRELRRRSGALIVVHELAAAGRSPHGILDNRRSDGLGWWIAELNHEL